MRMRGDEPTNGSLSSAITSVYPLNQGSPLCQARPWRNPARFTAGGVSFVGPMRAGDHRLSPVLFGVELRRLGVWVST